MLKLAALAPEKGRQWRSRLRYVFVATVTILSIMLAGLFYLFFEGSRKSIDAGAQRLRELAARDIESRVGAFLSQATRTTDDIEIAFKHEIISQNNLEGMETAFFTKLIEHPDLAEISLTIAKRTGSDESSGITLAEEGRECLRVYRLPAEPTRVLSQHVFRIKGKFVSERRLRPLDGGLRSVPWSLEADAAPGDPTLEPTFTTPASGAFYGKALWSDLHYSKVDFQPEFDRRHVVVTVQKAIEDGRSVFVGVLRTGLWTDQLDSIAKLKLTDEPGDPHRVFICDRDGKLVTRLSTADVFVETDESLRVSALNPPAEISAALALPARTQFSGERQTASVEFASGGKQFFATFRALKSSQDWVIGIVVPQEAYLGELLQARDRLLWQALLVIACILIGGIVTLRLSEFALLNMIEDTMRSRENVQQALDELQHEVAERKKIEAQLIQSQKMDAIGQLAGGVAHDFNNQLNAIMGFACLLADRMTDPTLKRYAANILKSTQRSADLTKKLLAFSRKGQFQAAPLSVHKLIAETVEMLERSIDKRIEITQSLHAESDIVVGDPSQMQNAFLNLAVNARDAMPQGGKLQFETDNVVLDSTTAAKYVGEAVPGQYVRFCLSDTGTGMTDEVKRHLFEPFFTTKPIGKGTGMGLASVFGTVKNHNGVIDVYSELNQGTTFKLYLPLANQTTAAEMSTARPSKKCRSLRALLVEDEEILREMFAAMLSSGGHVVVESENGRRALELYRQNWKTIDVVILDIIMPEMDGLDAFRAMKLINPKIKALLSSGFSLNKEVQTALDEGVLGFIQKPFMPNELLDLVAKVAGAG